MQIRIHAQQFVNLARQMLNITSTHQLASLGSNLIVTGIIIGSGGIVLDLTFIGMLLYGGKPDNHSARSFSSGRIGLLHSVNTYVHLIGVLITLLLMCIRTLSGDLHGTTYGETDAPWHCYLLAYCMSLFAAGVYGSCFLQALFRYWRIVLSSRTDLQKVSLHVGLIAGHWIFIALSLLPAFRSYVYIVSDHICLTPADDIVAAAYTATVVTVVPVTGLLILYVKIIRYLKHFSYNRRLRRRIRRDVFLIRRILILVIIIVQTSSSGIVLWLFVLIDRRFLSLFYRQLRFVIIVCMVICSVALFAVSPHLNSAARSRPRKPREQRCSVNQDTSLTRPLRISSL